MPSELVDGPPVAFVVFFVVVAALILFGIVRAAIGIGGAAARGSRPLPGDLGGQEHQRIVDQQIAQQGMTGMPPETGGMHGGHHHVDHTPPPTPPAA